MDVQQVTETMADDVVVPNENMADMSGSELEAVSDNHDHKSDEEDVALKQALDIQNIPVASPMRCGLARRGLGAIYSSTVSAPKQHLSPTRGVRNLASLLRSNNTMSGDDIVRLHEEAGPEAPELAKARARAARGRSALAKVSALVSERRIQETKAGVPKQDQTTGTEQESVEPMEKAEALNGPPEQGRSSPKSRNSASRSAVGSKASPEEKLAVEKKEEQAPDSVDDVDSNEHDNASAEHVVALPTKQDEAKSPRTSKGSSKSSTSKLMKRPAGRQSVKGNVDPALAEEGPAVEAQEPPTKKPKMDPEVEHFLSLGEKQREKHMMSLSFAKQSKLAMKISLAEGF